MKTHKRQIDKLVQLVRKGVPWRGGRGGCAVQSHAAAGSST